MRHFYFKKLLFRVSPLTGGGAYHIEARSTRGQEFTGVTDVIEVYDDAPLIPQELAKRDSITIKLANAKISWAKNVAYQIIKSLNHE